MDSRPPRPLIHNPNHQTSSSSSSSSSSQPTVYQPPSSQQPPVQIPFSDPFSQRRPPDPFMPNAQSQRRGSYSREHGDRTPLGTGWPPTSSASTAASQTQPTPRHCHPPTCPGPPPPPSQPSTQTSTAQAPFTYDSARRRSLGAHNGNDSHQLPGGFGRQMPPPSPSQQNQQPHGYAASRGPPPPPSFTAGRELPGLGAAPRSNTGFSISSILGAEPTTSQPPYSQSHHSPPVSTHSPSVSSMQPPSPRRGHSQSFGSLSQWRRPQTPDRSTIAAGMRIPESLAHSTGTSPMPFGQSRASPEYSRSNTAYNQAQYPVAPSQIPRPSQASSDDLGRPANDRAPPRPSSQPSGYGPPPREDAGVPPTHHATNGAAPQKQRPLRDEPRPPVSAYDDRNPSPSTSSRDRPVTVQPLAHSAYSPPRDLHRTSLGRDYLRDGRPREGSPMRRDDILTAFRPNHRELLREQGEPPRSHPSVTDQFRRQSEPQQLPNSVESAHGRPLHSHPPERSYSGEYPRSSLYDQPRAPGEEMQRSRSFLGITDPSKRGRASPLPQAVQGAQAQLTGPGVDPGIKREFGAIFQGLGSGLGGHLPGSSTPSRQSPMPQRMSVTDDTGPIVLSDNDGTMSRTGSRGPKKNRRIKDEDARIEIDDGRATPGARGAKRTKLSHHHHLPHTHPHHHHTHNHTHAPDSDVSIAQPQPQPTVNRFNTSLPYSTSSTPTAHHHHHIHPTHHHHHTARPPTASQAAPLRKPLIKAYSQSVLDSVKDLPRNHLGSELYNPKLEPSPPSPASSVLSSSKGGFRSIYKPSRTFTERDLNCTFTIRIPRFYLLAEERLRICSDRCLWGTDLYTDDSDPLAAAMHAGWIRAEWPPEFDIAQLNLTPPPRDTPDDVAVPDEMHAPPQSADIAEPTAAPAGVLPPPDLDLHVTLLILPKLKRYGASVRYGVASRSWPGTHDGFSYAIHKLRWVDEGAMRGCERSGRARREERRRRDREGKAVLRSLRGGKGARIGVGSRNGNAGVGAVPVGEIAA